MNESQQHTVSALPKHCIGSNKALRRDLLRSAPREAREALTVAGNGSYD